MQVITIEPGVYQVTSARDTSKRYDVEIDPRLATCTCPHYRFRCARQGLECKHIITVRDFIEAN